MTTHFANAAEKVESLLCDSGSSLEFEVRRVRRDFQETMNANLGFPGFVMDAGGVWVTDRHLIILALCRRHGFEVADERFYGERQVSIEVKALESAPPGTWGAEFYHASISAALPAAQYAIARMMRIIRTHIEEHSSGRFYSVQMSREIRGEVREATIKVGVLLEIQGYEDPDFFEGYWTFSVPDKLWNRLKMQKIELIESLL